MMTDDRQHAIEVPAPAGASAYRVPPAVARAPLSGATVSNLALAVKIFKIWVRHHDVTMMSPPKLNCYGGSISAVG